MSSNSVEPFSKAELTAILLEIAGGTLGVDEAKLVPSASLREDLGLDSIDMFDILVFIEKRTGRKLYGDQFKEVTTVEQFIDKLSVVVNQES
jgi:acyl carrier protein